MEDNVIASPSLCRIRPIRGRCEVTTRASSHSVLRAPGLGSVMVRGTPAVDATPKDQ